MKTDFETFLSARSSNALKSILLYGEDETYLNHCTDLLFEKHEGTPPSLSYEPTQISEDPSLLAGQDDLFLPAAKTLLIRGISDAFLSSLKPAFDLETMPLVIATTATGGQKLTKLKTFYQGGSDTALVYGYLNSEKAKKNFLNRLLVKYPLTLEADVMQALFDRMEISCAQIENDLYKLSFYKPNQTITFEDLQTCGTISEDAQLLDLIFSVADRSAPNIARAYTHLTRQGAEPIMILRALSSHFSKLLTLKGAVEDGMGLHQAFSSLRPPIFFKHHPKVTEHLKKWTLAEIADKLKDFREDELRFKNGAPLQSIQTEMIRRAS